MFNTEYEFITFFQKFLLNLVLQIEQQDIKEDIEVDLQDDILTIEIDQGVFIINKQSAMHELWLSSPISGPYHFSYNSHHWQTKTGIQLLPLLSKELNINLNND